MNETHAAPTPPARWHYATPAIVLHWTLAILIATMVAVGWYMMSIEDQPGSERYFNLHKSVGIVVYVLVLLRIVWRLSHKPAALPPSVPGWEVKLSMLAQRALYACMFVLPMLGFVGAIYSKQGIRFFGHQLPTFVAPEHDISERFFGMHIVLAWVMVAIIVLHAAGGLKHLLLDKDGVFQRMWFR